jgi:mannonate dehydratase
MKMTFRWYGYDDKNTLNYIRQIPGVSGVVTALYSVPVGEVWPEDEIKKLADYVHSYNLEMEVIESVPVSEDIKLRKGEYKKHIENYKQNIRNLAKYGVKCICYNFMPIFDWTRSKLDHVNKDGSKSLVYYEEDVAKMDPTKLTLPGWDASYKPEEVAGLIKQYQEIGEEGLWANLKAFLEEIIPVAAECGVNMAIHPDDPAWPVFGLPRIITCKDNILRLMKAVDNTHNGVTFCSGSYGTNLDNDLVDMIHSLKGRIHFAHVRNLKFHSPTNFEEAAHLSSDGNFDMYEIIKALYDTGFSGPIRPDHGRMIWDEKAMPGYGLYDRALGACYLNGLWEAVSKAKERGI